MDCVDMVMAHCTCHAIIKKYVNKIETIVQYHWQWDDRWMLNRRSALYHLIKKYETCSRIKKYYITGSMMFLNWATKSGIFILI